jgi:hypothetical protein
MFKQIEEYFLYKWANYRNEGLDDEMELALLEQLPLQV